MAEIELTDIPIVKVQDALNQLLDWNSLNRVREIHIGPRTITAVVYAEGSDGRTYPNDDNEAATHTLVRRIAL